MMGGVNFAVHEVATSATPGSAMAAAIRFSKATAPKATKPLS
jgi:hypothetical protein